MHARPFSTFALALLAFAAAASAQQAGTQPQGAQQQGSQQPKPKPVVTAPTPDASEAKSTEPAAPMDRELDTMRQNLVEGRTYRSHVRVTVRLKNGNRVTGIVKDGFVVERIDGMRFVETEANDNGAGVRIYTYSGKRNYVFLAFSEMQEYRINQRMTTAELQAYERKIRESEEAQQKQKDQQQVETAQPAPGTEVEGANAPVELQPATDAPKESATPAAPKKASVTDELQSMYSLLQEYPPAEGWNEAKRDEIARRRVVVGANPSAKEQKFVEKFADWQRACATLGAKAQGQQEQATTEESGSGSRRKKNR